MNNMQSKLLILLAAILWGTTGTSQGFAPSGAGSMSIGALRMVVGGGVMLVMALLIETRQIEKNKSELMKSHSTQYSILMAGMCMAVYQPLFFTGVKLTGVAFGTVLAIGSAPVFTGFIELGKGKKPTTRWTISTLMALLGCYLLFSGQGEVSVNFNGALYSLGAGLSYAVYVQASRKAFKSLSRLTVNGLIFSMSGLLLLPVLFFTDVSWVISLRGALVVCHLGLIATALAYTLFAFGLKNVNAPTAVTLTLGEPFTAAILGVLVFKETLSIFSITGVVILFAGLLITALPVKATEGQLDLSEQ